MKKHALPLVTAAVMLLGCASAPPAPEAPPPALEPEPALEPAPVETGGPWSVALISVNSEAKAARLSRLFADKGYRVEIEVVEIEGTAWSRLVFPGQDTREEAQQLLAQLEQEFGIQGGWILPPKN